MWSPSLLRLNCHGLRRTDTIDPPLELAGTSWVITNYRYFPSDTGITNPLGEEAVLVFGEDGTLTGHTGCNEFTGTWETTGLYYIYDAGDELDGQPLTITADVATSAECEGWVAEQGIDVIGALVVSEIWFVGNLFGDEEGGITLHSETGSVYADPLNALEQRTENGLRMMGPSRDLKMPGPMAVVWRYVDPMEFSIYPVLPAHDINRAAQWYRDKFGLEPAKHGGEPIPYGEHPEHYDEELLFDTGTARFNVYESAHAGKNQATAARLVAADFDAVFAKLKAGGVVFEEYDFGDDFRTIDGVLTSPDGERTCWFKDSEGNILALGSSD